MEVDFQCDFCRNNVSYVMRVVKTIEKHPNIFFVCKECKSRNYVPVPTIKVRNYKPVRKYNPNGLDCLKRIRDEQRVRIQEGLFPINEAEQMREIGLDVGTTITRSKSLNSISTNQAWFDMYRQVEILLREQQVQIQRTEKMYIQLKAILEDSQ